MDPITTEYITYGIILLIIFWIWYRYFYKHDIVTVVSDVDNKPYPVRDLTDKKQASNLLATVKHNITSLVSYLKTHKTEYPEFIPYIDRLEANIKNTTITETNGDSIHTSYSTNKGEEISFCLRSRKFKDQMHDINLVMYVALHELAHIACPEYGHTPLFNKIFAFITSIAIKIGLYKKVNFGSDPQEYCGITITESII